MTIGILVNQQSPTTDVYRVRPFTLLRHFAKYLDPVSSRWYDYADCDVLVVSRPNGSQVRDLIAEYKRMGKDKRVILDMDDLLHDLDPSNPSFQHFNRADVKESVIACLNLADYIIYSTPYLQDYYQPHHSDVPSTVIPNAVDFSLTPMQAPEHVHEPIRVLWRGSEHHKADLETIRPFWDWVLKDKRFEVLFMGLQPHDVSTFFPGASCIPWMPSPFQYWEKLATLRADVAVFPLKPTPFNYAKSNIFALEMLVAGVLPMVPAGFAEFEHVGTYEYDDTEELQASLSLMSSLPDRLEMIQDGQAWIKANRDLAQVNKARKQIIEKLWQVTEAHTMQMI